MAQTPANPQINEVMRDIRGLLDKWTRQGIHPINVAAGLIRMWGAILSGVPTKVEMKRCFEQGIEDARIEIDEAPRRIAEHRARHG